VGAVLALRTPADESRLGPAARSYDINVTPDKRKTFLHHEDELLAALQKARAPCARGFGSVRGAALTRAPAAPRARRRCRRCGSPPAARLPSTASSGARSSS